ncbi:aldehyde dehydrogenase, thermostable [mine drainage metagenome]|uniref:Aldehyde dehydrogenase, thermostable n=1 Tax=mine drainage metagenome TaxID=410659 RepID=A0A1J5QGG3_9ZZZZ
MRETANALRAKSVEAAALIVREVGKPIVEARGEVARAIAILDYYAQAALDPIGEVIPPSVPGMLIASRQAHGVAGLITPWNFPIAIPIWKAAPALAMGNAVVIKPSEYAIGCARFLEELFATTLPANIFTVVPGLAETGQALIANADVVSFTGSVLVGGKVVAAAAALGTPVQAEMGGQNPGIVLPDADLQLAATHLAQAAMGFAGQKCTATRRIIVVGDQARIDEVSQALIASVEALAPEDPTQEGVLVGPLIHSAARETFLSAAKQVISAGGRLLTGGQSLDRAGWFAKPALVTGLAPDHQLMMEETFAPFASIVGAKDVATAIELANSVRFGLTASVHGRDLEALLRVARELKTGMVKINTPTAGVDFHAPFGGTKDSSYGAREQGKDALRFYSVTRTVTIGAGTRIFE